MDYAVLTRLVAKDDDFDAKHPRDDRGRFAEGGGGAGEPGGGSRREGGRGRAVTEQVPRESAKAALARQTSRLVDASVQRYSEEGCEPVLAKGLGGVSLKDNEPVDVMVVEKGVVRHGVELKVMTDNKQNKVYMKQDAIDRKVAWMRQNRAEFHTVVFDDTNVFHAGGTGHHDESERRIFYRRGFGSFRVDVMHEVTGGMKELKQLMATPMKELPEAARHSGKTPYPRVRPRKGWFAEAYGRASGVVRYSPDQPRDDAGRFGEGGGGRTGAGSKVETDASGRGRVVENPDGTTSYAGVHESEWTDWAHESEQVNAALRGELKPGDVDSTGNPLGAKEVAELKATAEKIQAAASANAVKGAVYRGESYADADSVPYRARAEVVLPGLTSTATGEDAALEYAASEEGAGHQVLVVFSTSENAVRGVQTAPLGVPSNEVVLPMGDRYRVARVEKSPTRTTVHLYSKQKHGIKPVNAERPEKAVRSDVALMAAAVRDLAEAVTRPAARVEAPRSQAPTALKLTHPDGRVTTIDRVERQEQEAL